MHIGEAAVCAIVPHREPGVVDTQKVQNGGVHIVDRCTHPVGGLEAERIGGANTDTPLDTTTSQPVRKAVRVVIAPLASLRAGHAAKFGGPEHNGVIQQAGALEIGNQCGRGPGHTGGQGAVVAADILMAIPVASRETVVTTGPDLHKSHTPLQQAPGHQALAAHGVGLFQVVDLSIEGALTVVEAIEAQHLGGFTAPVERFGGGSLQAGSQLVGAQPGLETVIARAVIGVAAVEFGQKSTGGLLGRRPVTRRVSGREKVVERLFLLYPQHGPLVVGG